MPCCGARIAPCLVIERLQPCKSWLAVLAGRARLCRLVQNKRGKNDESSDVCGALPALLGLRAELPAERAGVPGGDPRRVHGQAAELRGQPPAAGDRKDLRG